MDSLRTSGLDQTHYDTASFLSDQVGTETGASTLEPEEPEQGPPYGRLRPGGGPGDGSAGSLGRYTKQRATFPDPGLAQISRYVLLGGVRQLLPDSRTGKCMRFRVPGQSIQVWRTQRKKSAFYAGLQVCGSVWVCPVCSAKISERRRLELVEAMASQKAAGGTVSLLTLTTPHQRSDDLATLLERQGKALEGFLRDRTVKKVLGEMGYLGQVKALEVTHGRNSPHNNGWHPHFHFLMFHQKVGDRAQRHDWTVRLYNRWSVYCVKVGLGMPLYIYGIKLDDGTQAANYVAKGMWGLDHEMTKGHTKRGKEGSETPFDFLRAYMADHQDTQAAALFVEFRNCFKGKQQLSWSRGLKARFLITDKSDDQLAEEHQDELAVLLGMLTADQWRDVLKVDGRGQLLDIAAKGGWSHVQKYLHFIDGARDGVQFQPGMLDEVRQLLTRETA